MYRYVNCHCGWGHCEYWRHYKIWTLAALLVLVVQLVSSSVWQTRLHPQITYM